METGKGLLAKNDAGRAILEFRNAARLTPKNPEVYYQLGLAHLMSGDSRNGIGSLRKALELNPKHEAAQLRMAQLMTQANDPGLLKDALRRLEGLLADAPGNAPALHALALTEMKLGEPEDAIQHLERAIAAAPQELILAITMAQAKLRRGDSKGAEDVLKKASEDSPKSADALVTLGRFYSSQNKAGEAERQFHRALAINPDHAAALLNLAALQGYTGRKQEAEQNFKRLSGLPGKQFKTAYALFLFQEGRRDEAIRDLERLAKESPGDHDTRTRLVAAYQAVNRMADAERVLAAALKKNPKDLDALLQRAELFVGSGNYGQAELDLNQVLRLKPDAPELHYVMAKLQEARHSVLSYREELTKALQLNPYLLPVRLELVRSLLASASGAQTALNVLDAAPSYQKEQMPLLVQRNWVFWTLGDLAKMRKGIDSGLSQQRSAELLIQDGLWKLRGGKPAEARASLQEALKLNPADLRALGALSQSYVAQKQPSVALQKVKEYAAVQPKAAAVQAFLGTMLVASGDHDQARVAFAAAKAANPQFAEADLSLAQVDVLERKWDDARKRLEAVLASDNGNLTARQWLGNIEELNGNHSAAIEHFQKVVDANPNNAQASNNLAYLLAENGSQPDKAVKYAERAVELAPERAAYCDTLGWALYRKGLYGPAIKYLERATSTSQGSALSKYHLAMAYAKAGDIAHGRSTLEAALKLNSDLPEAKIAQQVVGAAR